MRKPTKAQVRFEAEFNREVQEAIVAVRSSAMVDDHLSSDVSNGSCQSKGSRGSSPCQKMISASPASPASDGVNAEDHEVDSQDLGDFSIEAVRNEEDSFDFKDNEDEEGGLEYLSFEYDKLMQQYPQRRNTKRGKDAKKKLRLKHERAQGLHSSQDILLRDTCSRIPLGTVTFDVFFVFIYFVFGSSRLKGNHEEKKRMLYALSTLLS